MCWQQLKEKYERIKRWQRQPTEYRMNDESHTCQCCGQHFVGNFCPCCSQKAGVGRISWLSVHQGVMDIWGLGTRSLLRSLWQLLTRTGYFISEYINGKRQVSFPPVKMLFIVALIYSFIAYWLFPDVLHISLEQAEQDTGLASQFKQWSQEHYSWSALLLSTLAIIPTWLMFRYSPRNTRHTLPEGFFIQVFFSVLGIALSFLLIPLRIVDSIIFAVSVSLVSMVYYIVGYMQLFGYSLWGTLWRQGFIYVGIMCLTGALMFGVIGLSATFSAGQDVSEKEFLRNNYSYSALFVMVGIAVLTVGFVINLIATRKMRKEMKLNQRRSSVDESQKS